MNIGGIEPLSLIDYPGTPAVVLFLQGCNWRCPFCHNSSLWSLGSPNNAYPVEQVMALLQARRDRIPAVVLSGGEPTLQPGLADFIVDIKKMGYLVKLDTNGAQPQHLAQLIDQKLLDYIAMDIKAPWMKYDLLAGVAVDCTGLQTSIACIAASGVAHHFRTTYPPHLLTGNDLAAIKKSLPDTSRHIVQEYREL